MGDTYKRYMNELQILLAYRNLLIASVKQLAYRGDTYEQRIEKINIVKDDTNPLWVHLEETGLDLRAIRKGIIKLNS